MILSRLSKILLLCSHTFNILYLSTIIYMGGIAVKIESLLPVLLSLLNGRAGKQQRPGPATQFSQKTTGEPQPPLENSGIKNKIMAAAKEADQPDQSRNQVNNLPDFLPLSLKSTLFPASRYYIQRDEQNSRKNNGHDSTVNLFINLDTLSLGSLWVTVTARSRELVIRFYSGEETYTHIIMEGLPELTGALKEKGFSPVNVTAHTRPGIKSCADLVMPGRNLSFNNIYIDLKI